MKKFESYKGVIIALVIAALIIMYFTHMSKISKGEEDDESAVVASAVTNVLQRNMITNYPQTPKEVVKYFSDITRCYYNETLTEDDVKKLANQMLFLYDDDLVNAKTYDEYIMDLKSDIAFYNMNGYTISSYTPSASTDVFFFNEDGYEWARLFCVYNIRAGKEMRPIEEVFVLRKDEDGHWRIFGWKKTESQE